MGAKDYRGVVAPLAMAGSAYLDFVVGSAFLARTGLILLAKWLPVVALPPRWRAAGHYHAANMLRPGMVAETRPTLVAYARLGDLAAAPS